MYTRARVLGQPVNPVLMLLPLAILVTATMAQLGAVLSGLNFFATISHADMIPGLVSGVIALCALLVDLLTAPAGSAARAVLTVVCTAFGATIALFTIVFSVQGSLDGGGGGILLFELLGLGCGIVAAKLARNLALGRPLPKRLVQAQSEQPADSSRAGARRAIARRWIPAPGIDDPDSTVAIFGYATGRAPVPTS